MSRIYNKYIDQAVKTIDSVQPTFGQEKTEKFKKKLKIKKLEKELGKKPIKNFNKGGRVELRGGSGFPDLNKDGETTFADVLIGRGVIPKNKKNKKKMMAKKSETPMDKAVKKDKKKKRII